MSHILDTTVHVRLYKSWCLNWGCLQPFSAALLCVQLRNNLNIYFVRWLCLTHFDQSAAPFCLQSDCVFQDYWAVFPTTACYIQQLTFTCALNAFLWWDFFLWFWVHKHMHAKESTSGPCLTLTFKIACRPRLSFRLLCWQVQTLITWIDWWEGYLHSAIIQALTKLGLVGKQLVLRWMRDRPISEVYPDQYFSSMLYPWKHLMFINSNVQAWAPTCVSCGTAWIISAWVSCGKAWILWTLSSYASKDRASDQVPCTIPLVCGECGQRYLNGTYLAWATSLTQCIYILYWHSLAQLPSR